MKRFTFCLVLLLLTVSGVFGAMFEETTGSNPALIAREVTKDNNGMSIQLEINQPSWFTVGNDAEPVDIVEYEGSGYLEMEGFPLVPTTGGLFRLPPRSGVTIEILNAEYETYADIDYAVFAGIDNPDDYIRSATPEDSWFPGLLAEVGEPAVMREFRVGSLTTYPVQVNTARREVRVYSNIEVAITYEGEDERNSIFSWPTHLSETFLPFYRQLLDWDEDELDEYTLYRGAVQLVSRTNVLDINEMEEWLEWKLQKGWIIEHLTPDDIGTWSASNIKSELQDRWDDSELKFDYVLVIGDNEGIYSTPPGSGYGDHEYCRLVGNDQLIDCAHGRISVETESDVAVYANKVLAYERDPDLDNTDWYVRGSVSANSASSGTSTIYLGRYARHAMLDIGYAEVDTAWYNDGLGNVTDRDIDHLNDGVSMYGHRGYLGTGLSSAEINNLSNSFMTPVVLDITCATGDWTSGWSDGLNEVWMRAGTANSPRGGIVAMGMHTTGTHTKFNNCLTGGAWFSMLVQRNPTVGQALYGAKYNLYQNMNSYLPNDVSNFNQWCNMMGDPLVYIWTAIPQPLDVTASTTVNVGESSYPVTVIDDVTGEPVEGAWVTFYKMDDDEIIARGVTGPDGQATLYIPTRNTGTGVLTVTQQNYAPYQRDVNVTVGLVSLGYHDISILDDNTEGTIGNGNGIAESGETVGVVITANNFGLLPQQDVEASITCDDFSIESITGTSSFGNVNAGETVVADQPVLVELDPETQNEWIAHLEIEFTSTAGTFNDGYPLTINAAQFAYVDFSIEGGVLNPAQTRDLTVTIANIGNSNATGESTAELVSVDTMLTVTQSTATFGQMNVGQEDESTEFTIEAHSYSFPGHQASVMMIVTTSSSQVDTVHLNIPIGQRSSTDPTGPDRYGYYAYDNTDTDYSEMVPVYDWIEINPNVGGNDFDGTDLNISDTGNNVDDAEVMDLPFTVQYYGELFDQITVTANGMVSMGDQGDMRNPRNWTIPSPIGPEYMIAPYWDERRTSGGNDVYWYYDEVGDQLIIEWYQVTDINNSYPCTFEMIIYNLQEGHETWTGDNEILFQYHTLTHSSGSWTDVPYFTTGIENGDQTDGLLISYWNQETPGSADVDDGRAILFSTNINAFNSDRPYPFSLLAPDNESIFENDENVLLTWEEAIDPNGDPITYTVQVASDHSFNNIVLEEETEFRQLWFPAQNENNTYYWKVHAQDLNSEGRWSNVWSFTAYSFLPPTPFSLLTPVNGVTVPEDVVTVTWEASTDQNWPGGALAAGGPTIQDRAAERADEFNLWIDLEKGSTEGDGEGIAELDDFGGPDGYGYKWIDSDEMQGPSYTWYDIDVLGEYSTAADADEAWQTVTIPFDFPFYDQVYNEVTICANGYLHFGDPESDWSNSTIPDPDGPPAMIAPFWDDLSPQNGSGIFWGGSAALGVFGVQWEANPHYTYDDCEYTFQVLLYEDGEIIFTYESMVNRLNSATIGIENQSETDGLLMTFNADYISDGMVIRIMPWDLNYRVEFSAYSNFANSFVEYTTDTQFTIGQPEVVQLVTEQGGFWGTLTDDQVFVEKSPFTLETTDPYIDVLENELDWTIPDGVTVYWRIAVINQWDRYALGNPWTGYNFTVELPPVLTGMLETELGMPTEFEVSQAYPNPFNPVTSLQVALPLASDLNVTVYNVLGKEVTSLASGKHQAGYHNLVFDASGYSSGIYFIHTEVPGKLNELRKVVLMK